MEKTDILFQMMEQPDHYTVQQWEEILSDKECRELYTLMSKTKGAIMREYLKQDTKPEPMLIPHPAFRMPLRKIAAVLLSVIVLSSFAYAAVCTNFFTQTWTETSEVTVMDAHKPSSLIIVPTDTIQKPVGTITFDNEELAEILTSICNAYKVEIHFKNEEQKHIRMHFSYDSKDNLDDVVESMNMFEKIHLSLKDKILMVE